MIAQWHFIYELQRIQKFTAKIVNASPNGEVVMKSHSFDLLERAVNNLVEMPKRLRDRRQLIRRLWELCGLLEAQIYLEDYRKNFDEADTREREREREFN